MFTNLSKLIARIWFSEDTQDQAATMHELLKRGRIFPQDFENLAQNGLSQEIINCWRWLYEDDYLKLNIKAPNSSRMDEDETFDDPSITFKLNEFVKKNLNG